MRRPSPKVLRRLKEKSKAQAPVVSSGEAAAIDFLAGLTDSQRAFVLDAARYKTALTTRQAGKTHSVLRLLLKTATEYPGSVCLYLGLTQVAAKRLFWKRLQDEAMALGVACRANQVECSLKLDNGSMIMVSGAETESDIRAFRGLVCRLIVLDEAQDFPPFATKLVQEVLDPTLNTTQGTMALTGTPNSLCQGYFFEATTSPGSNWSRHRWVGAENPAAHQNEADLDQIKARMAWTEESPAFRREYRGEWVPSDEELVYQYSRALNEWDGSLPDSNRTYVLGLDIGFRDRTTFVVACYTDRSPHLYFVEVLGLRGLTVDGIANKIKELKKRYPFQTIVADTGGLGKMICESLIQRYHLNIIPAKKADKLAAQRMINTDFRLGNIKATHGTPLTEEWSHLTILPDGSENKTQANDYCDAALYAHRHCRAYMYREPIADTEDYGDKRMRLLQEKIDAEKKAEARAKGMLFGNDGWDL